MINKPDHTINDLVESTEEYKIKMPEYANDKFIVKDLIPPFGENKWLVTFYNLFGDFHYPANFYQKINE